MSNLIARLATSIGFTVPKPSSATLRVVEAASPDDLDYRIGDYCADYSAIPVDEIAQPLPEMEELLRNSTVISVKRGL